MAIWGAGIARESCNGEWHTTLEGRKEATSLSPHGSHTHLLFLPELHTNHLELPLPVCLGVARTCNSQRSVHSRRSRVRPNVPIEYVRPLEMFTSCVIQCNKGQSHITIIPLIQNLFSWIKQTKASVLSKSYAFGWKKSQGNSNAPT